LDSHESPSTRVRVRFGCCPLSSTRYVVNQPSRSHSTAYTTRHIRSTSGLSCPYGTRHGRPQTLLQSGKKTRYRGRSESLQGVFCSSSTLSQSMAGGLQYERDSIDTVKNKMRVQLERPQVCEPCKASRSRIDGKKSHRQQLTRTAQHLPH